MPQYYYFAGEGMPFYESSYQSGRAIMPPSHPGRASMLGGADWLESGAPRSKRYPPTRSMVLSTGDWPPVRTSGPEPLDPGEMPHWQSHPMEVGALQLSSMEKTALGLGALVLVGYFAMKALK
jgi:hypothetical protein